VPCVLVGKQSAEHNKEQLNSLDDVDRKHPTQGELVASQIVECFRFAEAFAHLPFD
jgi:hypothetical protein